MSNRAPLSYTTTRLTLGTFLRIMFRPRYLDKNKIPVEGPLIIAANHLSHIDPAFIMTAIKRPVSYMSKKEHFDGAIRCMRKSSRCKIYLFLEAAAEDSAIEQIK